MRHLTVDSPITHVYLMPGMAANPSIFEHIKLPEDTYRIHWLEWEIPVENETLEAYAERMALKITEDNAVLIGVSFGGILVQEMSAYLNLKKLIIVSSVKSRQELPAKMHWARRTKAYKILPTQLAQSVDTLAKYSLGKTVNKRVELYKKYLSVNDPKYLDWAIKQVVCWKRKYPDPKVVHVHGDSDMVFPIKNIEDCKVIKGGTHIMIINKYKWFNEQLPKLIEA